jgi:hypothetical protein
LELDPVFVVESQARSRASSRGVCLAVCVAFALGGALGSTGGFAIGQVSANCPPQEYDADIVRMQRLATEAPIDELLDNGWEFLSKLGHYNHKVEAMWQGFERIAVRITEPTADVHKQELARFANAVLAKSSESAVPARIRSANIMRIAR